MRPDLLIFSILIATAFTQPLTPAEPTSMTLNSGQVFITPQANTSTLDFPCSARVGSCTFSYLLLPPGWTSQGNSLVVPAAEINSIRSYALQVRMTEPTGDYMIRNIVVDFNRGTATFTSTLIESNFGISRSPISSASVTSAPAPTDLPTSSLNQYGETFLQSIGVVASLPPIPKLDQIIVSADVYKISSTIQDIVEFREDCSTKLAYLEQATSRIKQHIEFNQQLLGAEEAKIRAAQSQLQSLQDEKNRITEQLAALGDRSKLQEEVKQLTILKQDSYAKYFSNNAVAGQYLQRFQRLVGNSAVSPDRLAKVKSQIEADKKQLQNVKQRQLELRILQAALQTRIESNSKIVQDTDSNPTVSAPDPQLVKTLEDKYKQYSQLALQFKQAENDATDKLAVAQKKLDSVRASSDTLSKRLKQIDASLAAQTQTHLSDSMKDIRTRIDVLTRNLPKLQTQVSQCQSEVNDQKAAAQPASVVYISRPSALANSQIPSDQKSGQLYSINDLRVNEKAQSAINIYSSNWIRNYGVASTFSFVCASSGSLVNGHGVLLSIIGGSIKVQDGNGNVYSLHIGVCSKLLGANSSYAPRVGDVIDWSGVPLSANTYNLYRAVFYSLR